MPEDTAASSLRPIHKLLVANRSEIAIRVFRSAHELGIRTVALYSHEDRFALHRFKADEAYRIGNVGEPIRAYLDIAAVINLAKQYGIDGIHPGYGFLSENAHFARACRDAGIVFVGPRVEILEQLGDKVVARRIARQASVPVLPGGDAAVKSTDEAKKLAETLGYPVIVQPALDPALRQGILDAALAVGRAVRLDNAGTVEFLVDADSGQFYFIEVNPRVQVEHTVTEQVTGYDIVQSQILVAQGLPLSAEDI